MKFDLHMHSACSPDGELSPQQLADMAHARGLSVIALTDHDRIQGIQELTDAAEKYGIEVIPGIECSTMYGDDNVHLLGYGIDLQDPYFQTLPSVVKEHSARSFEKRYWKMKEKYGFETSLEDVYADAAGRSPWFSLIKLIMQEDVIRNHPDFQPYYPGGKRSEPAAPNFYWDKMQNGSDLYVRTGYPDIFETIDRIHAAGGVAVVAHPFHTFWQQPEKLQRLKDYGLDGLEACSNYHTGEMNAWYRNLAEEMGLLITCGSDFHGAAKPKIVMGEYGLEDPETADTYLQALRQALAATSRK